MLAAAAVALIGQCHHHEAAIVSPGADDGKQVRHFATRLRRGNQRLDFLHLSVDVVERHAQRRGNRKKRNGAVFAWGQFLPDLACRKDRCKRKEHDHRTTTTSGAARQARSDTSNSACIRRVAQKSAPPASWRGKVVSGGVATPDTGGNTVPQSGRAAISARTCWRKRSMGIRRPSRLKCQ